LVPDVIKNKIKVIFLHFSTNKVRTMNNTTKTYLKSFFKEDIDKLSRLIEKDLKHWTK